MQGNLWLSITQIVVGLVLGFQSVLESKRVHREMTKLTKRMDETGAKVVENPEYLFLLIDSVEHILFSINKEGCVDWQKGIPKPIKLELDTIKREIANIKKNMGVNDKWCASRQTLAILLRKQSSAAPCGHRLRCRYQNSGGGYSVASYILSFLREERLGEKGGAFFG